MKANLESHSRPLVGPIKSADLMKNSLVFRKLLVKRYANPYPL
jgi:hypothetical protein